MPVWFPIVAIGGSILSLAFVAWLLNKGEDKLGVRKLNQASSKATQPTENTINETVSSIVVSPPTTAATATTAAANATTAAANAANATTTTTTTTTATATTATTATTTATTAAANAANAIIIKNPSTKKKASWVQKPLAWVISTVGLTGIFFSTSLPQKIPKLLHPTKIPVSRPYIPTPAPSLEAIAKAIPPLTQQPIYQLEFTCAERTLQVSKTARQNTSSFPPVVPQIVEALPKTTACEETLPVLNTWGKNRPSPFLLGIYRNKQLVGIQIPKQLPKNKLDDLSLEELSSKLPVEFGSLVWFNETLRKIYEQLSPTERKQQFEIRYIAIAPKIEINQVDRTQPIPIKTRYLPEELQPKLREAFSLINASPEGREILRKAEQYDIALHYSPTSNQEEKQTGYYSVDGGNAVFLNSALLNKEHLNTPEGFNFLILVLTHELGHGIVTNERLKAIGKPVPPDKNLYDKDGSIISGLFGQLPPIPSASSSVLEESTVNNLATTIATQLVEKLPSISLLEKSIAMNTSINSAKNYAFYSHPGLPNFSFLQETPTRKEADTIYTKLGLGDFAWNRWLATEATKKRTLLDQQYKASPKN
jgi:hypothetical protein